MKMKRNEFLKTLGAASATIIGGNAVASTVNSTADERNMPSASVEQMKQSASKIKLGVSLYSYQHAVFTKSMTLEDCLAELHDIGAEGVQIISETTIPNYPYPPESWVEKWFSLLDKYQLTPTLINTYVDNFWGWRRQAMSMQEQIETFVVQCKLAKRLGFPLIRPNTTKTSSELYREALPYAEEYGLKLALEIHSPMALKYGPQDPVGYNVKSIMDIANESNSKSMGFILDMGAIPYRYSPLRRDRLVRGGVLTGEIALYIEQAWEKGENKERVMARVKRMNPLPADIEYVDDVYTGMYNDPNDLKPLLPYIFNVHGKFYEMTEDLKAFSIAYEETFKVLVEGGWEGYIDTEYEGQRYLCDQWCEPIDEVEQVRRHHAMMRRLLGRA